MKKFSKSELAEITKLVREQNVDAAAKRFGKRADAFFLMRREDSELEEAIKLGQRQRQQGTMFHQALEVFTALSKEELADITKIASEGGLKAVTKKYNVSAHILGRCRKELPDLENAVKTGLRHRPVGFSVEKNKKNIGAKKPKVYKKKDEFRKPPEKLVNKTKFVIYDDSEAALAKFQEEQQEAKELRYRQQLRNGDYDNMI